MATPQMTGSMYCRRCGYELAGLSEDRCPECGQAFDPNNRWSFSRHRWGWNILRRRWLVAAGLLPAVIVLASWFGWAWWEWRAEQVVLADVRKVGGTVKVSRPAWVRSLPGELGCLWERTTDVGLRLTGQPIDDTWLAKIAQLKHLESLDLGQSAVTDEGLLQLKHLESLRSLDLERTRIDGRGLACLRKSRGLQSVNLRGTRINDAGLAHLAGLVNMRILILDDTQVTGAGLVHLRNMTALQSLTLANTPVGDAGTEHLKPLVKLEYLWLAGTKVDLGLANLKGLPALWFVEMDHSSVTDDGLVHLAELKSLKWLNVSGSRQVTDRGLEALLRHSPLQDIYVWKTGVTAEGIAKLREAWPEARIGTDVPKPAASQGSPQLSQ